MKVMFSGKIAFMDAHARSTINAYGGEILDVNIRHHSTIMEVNVEVKESGQAQKIGEALVKLDTVGSKYIGWF